MKRERLIHLEDPQIPSEKKHMKADQREIRDIERWIHLGGQKRFYFAIAHEPTLGLINQFR